MLCWVTWHMSRTIRTSRILSIVGVALFVPSGLFAQVIVSEIMYDLSVGSDTGREWVEVFNSSASSVNLTEWKLFENGTNHGIVAHTGGDTLVSGAYAVLADNPTKFLIDWPAFSGLLFDSAFSLSNTGEVLVLRCCNSDLIDKDSLSYGSEMGGAGDGNTLNRSSVSATTFTSSTPTPGSGTISGSSSGGGSTSTSSANTLGAVSSYVSPWEPMLFAHAGGDRVVTVGADITLDGQAYTRDREPIEDGVRFTWSFGDGGSAEGRSVLHHWSHPGRYAVVLTIAEHTNAASDTVIVEAKAAKFVVGILQDSSIAVSNESGRDLDLSNWILSAGQKYFVIPPKTTILAGATVAFSPYTTGLTTLVGDIALQYPNGTMAAKVGDSPVEVPPPVPVPKSMAQVVEKNIEEGVEEIAGEVVREEVSGTTTSSQGAAAGSSTSYMWWVGALFVAFLGALAVFFLRRSELDGWTIIEEEGGET